MTEPFTIVGYYTDRYADNAHEFMSSCADVGVKFHCQHVPDRGSWALNTSYKPTFLLECINIIPGNIVYCDVDARLERYPKLFEDTKTDVMFYKGGVWSSHNTEVLSGTIFLRNNEIIKKFLSNWANNCDNNNQEWDQRLIERSLPEGIGIGYLPIEYCAVFDSPRIVGKDVVIRHLQASRVMRQFDRR